MPADVALLDAALDKFDPPPNMIVHHMPVCPECDEDYTEEEMIMCEGQHKDGKAPWYHYDCVEFDPRVQGQDIWFAPCCKPQWTFWKLKFEEWSDDATSLASRNAAEVTRLRQQIAGHDTEVARLRSKICNLTKQAASTGHSAPAAKSTSVADASGIQPSIENDDGDRVSRSPSPPLPSRRTRQARSRSPLSESNSNFFDRQPTPTTSPSPAPSRSPSATAESQKRRRQARRAPAAATTTTGTADSSQSKQLRWTRAEMDIVANAIQEMVDEKKEEENKTGKSSIGEFRRVSHAVVKLAAAGYVRKYHAVRNWWNRNGRADYGIEERDDLPDGAPRKQRTACRTAKKQGASTTVTAAASSNASARVPAQGIATQPRTARKGLSDEARKTTGGKGPLYEQRVRALVSEAAMEASEEEGEPNSDGDSLDGDDFYQAAMHLHQPAVHPGETSAPVVDEESGFEESGAEESASSGSKRGRDEYEEDEDDDDDRSETSSHKRVRLAAEAEAAANDSGDCSSSESSEEE